jgi:hypothetical protein
VKFYSTQAASVDLDLFLKIHHSLFEKNSADVVEKTALSKTLSFRDFM